jgi:hypothetical protein
MTLSLERITDTLPIGFAELEVDAKADGHDHLSRLAAEFAQTPTPRNIRVPSRRQFGGDRRDYRGAWPDIAADMADAAALRASQI